MRIAIIGKGHVGSALARGFGRAHLAREIGFDAVDSGPLKNARYLEPLAALNIQLGYAQKLGTDVGFSFVR